MYGECALIPWIHPMSQTIGLRNLDNKFSLFSAALSDQPAVVPEDDPAPLPPVRSKSVTPSS